MLRGFVLSIIVLIFLNGCAGITEITPDEEITQTEDGKYEILDVDYRGVFGGEKSLINSVVRKAEKFAEGQGKVASPISARIHRVGIMGDWAWFYYKFELVEKNTPEAYKNFTDITIVRDPRLASEIYLEKNKDDDKSKYDDLIKLDELRQKGILTDSEFEAEKKHILGK